MKIIQEYEKCISCGNCIAVCSDFWELDEGGKARPKGGKKNPKTGNYELEIEESSCNKDAEASCPVQIIHIIQ